MSAKRVSILQVMMVIALAAVNLAVARAALGVDIYPQVLVVLLGSNDLLVIWRLILNRSLWASWPAGTNTSRERRQPASLSASSRVAISGWLAS
jgi:hypothetical protein